jgi:hypothetical protein
MSYYILPKNNNIVNVNPFSSIEECKPYLSCSFLNYYLEIKRQIVDMFILDSDVSDNTFDDAIRIINPYEFIFSKVPGSKFSVSKLKPNSNLFYDLFEIMNNFNFFDDYKNQSIKSLHISPNVSDSVDCYEMFREGISDEIIDIDSIDYRDNFSENELSDSKFEYIFFETNTTSDREYIISLINSIIIVLKNQKYNGSIIIKIKDILYKPIFDCVYYLTSLYEKVYISKPNTNNITSLERYIVCKSFQFNETTSSYLKLNYIKLIVLLKKLEDKNITTILDTNVPYYFKNKIDDLNIIIGQQQIEGLDQIISIFKNKNRNEKIETIKKSNIQKSVSWCEKYKIPCNKFTEKINIFLPIVNESVEG